MDGEKEPPAEIEVTTEKSVDKKHISELIKMIVMIVVLSYLILWFAIYFFHNYREPIKNFIDSLTRQLIL